MRKIFILMAMVLGNLVIAQNEQVIYDYQVEDISGKEFDLSSLKGKKVMIVNTASKCGFTPQYASLQKLYEQYKFDDFVIIGFPSNDFGNQEPGSNEEIEEFCQQNYGVDFPMMSKITVKGKDMHPLYKFLTQKKKNGFKDSEVKWNFQKYLIDENGKLVAVLESNKLPNDPEVINWISE
ncbi:glutathione peroxidase [Zunongwangia endophytica]|uniref:Glutathione peroxidase n=1 Tax=Zunongwangia endophytica TaxID=1808945 RepID=A0ABV8HBX7_9FLAO|nr:glutathione peroxidase [Zunongwangia endophytica]MDN3596902.1 glutathione peroxidase [Zunongwangia endophytica]